MPSLTGWLILKILAVLCFALVFLTAFGFVQVPGLPIVALGLCLWCVGSFP